MDLLWCSGEGKLPTEQPAHKSQRQAAPLAQAAFLSQSLGKAARE